MNDKDSKLSSYIDTLNNERKPDEHDIEMDLENMDDLLETVRLVRSLKEPTLPDDDFSKKLAANINKQLIKEKNEKKLKHRWITSISSAAAAVALIFILNAFIPFNKNNIVSAMEQAFNGIKAYHGIIQIVEKSADGKSNIQSEEEVWADKEGHYYVKQLNGYQKGVITVNNGEKKWQVQPGKKEVDVFSAFPDPFAFTFELGKEINDVKNAVKTKVIGDGNIAGRASSIIEVTPQGGTSYKIWVDKETKLPLQKQSAMEYSLQYTVQYTNIDFKESVPKNLLTYTMPEGFKEVNKNPEQVVNNLEEAKRIAGFEAKLPQGIPDSYSQNSISVETESKVIKLNYISQDNSKKVSILQKKVSEEFKPASTAILGKINNSTVEIQSPIQEENGILLGGGAYAGNTNIISIRWQQDGFEYAVIGSTSLDQLALFVKAISGETLQLPAEHKSTIASPKVIVPYDLKVEEGDQKNADAGHSPWKLDPAFVAQVFVSLKLSPGGIQGDYPIDYKEFKVVKNDGKEALVEVGGQKTPISKVYLKRLIRQDNTGIWTVIGYDPK